MAASLSAIRAAATANWLARESLRASLDSINSCGSNDGTSAATPQPRASAVKRVAGPIALRPHNKVVAELRLAPVAAHFADLLGPPVTTVAAVTGPEAEAAARALKPG